MAEQHNHANKHKNDDTKAVEKNDDDTMMTHDERETWLREHGVLIESPQDRKRNEQLAHSVLSITQQMSSLDMDSKNDKDDDGSVKFVCIPHDDTLPMRTLKLPLAVIQSTVGDALPNYVKPQFADQVSIDATLLQEQAKKQLVGGNLEHFSKTTNLSTAAMNAAASQGSVETFCLVHPAGTNHYTGVYIYLDEVGLLKKLPFNARASQIAQACGYYPPPNFYGTVFVGRVQTKPRIRNIDFVAGVDTDSSSAEWMKRAISENLAWQQEFNKVSGKTQFLQPAPLGTDGTVASEEKFQWTQDDEEIEIRVSVSSSSTPSCPVDKKLVKITFSPRQVQVKYNEKELLTIPLYSGIDVDGCTWTIDGNHIIITCEKANGGELWPRIQ